MAEIDMDAAPAAVAKARASGFSDDQIFDYFAKQAPEQFAKAKATGRSSKEIINYLAGPTSAQPSEQSTEPTFATQPAPEQPMAMTDVAKQAALNLIPSTGRLIGDVGHAVMHPIETAENIKNIGAGLLEQSGLAGSVLPPTGGGHEQYAKALEQYFVDRYGGGPEGIEGFKKAFAKDPASFLADFASIASGGGGILAKIPGVARVGELVAKAGSVVDPLTNVGRVAQATGIGLGKGVGVLTGTGDVPLRVAYEAGQEGGAAGQAFRQNLMGKEPSTNVISDAKTALGNMREQRGIEYNAGMTPVKGDKTVLDFTDVDNAIKNMEDVATYKGQVIAPKTEKIRSEIKQVINHWKGLDPAEYHTPEGFDALKQQIGELRDLTQQGTPDRLVANQAYNAVKGTIVNQSPGYAKVMEGYQKASEAINEIQKALSLGENATADTALRKLQSVMRNNVQTNYGRRTDLAKMLTEHGAPNLMEKLAGQALSSAVPRGLAKYVAGGLIEGVPAAAGLAKGGLMAGGLAAAKYAPALALTSPLLMGGLSHGLGMASRYAPLSTLPGRVTRIPTAAERLYGGSQR